MTNQEKEDRIVLGVCLTMGLIASIMLIWSASMWVWLGVFLMIWADNISKKHFKR